MSDVLHSEGIWSVILHVSLWSFMVGPICEPGRSRCLMRLPIWVVSSLITLYHMELHRSPIPPKYEPLWLPFSPSSPFSLVPLNELIDAKELLLCTFAALIYVATFVVLHQAVHSVCWYARYGIADSAVNLGFSRWLVHYWIYPVTRLCDWSVLHPYVNLIRFG